MATPTIPNGEEHFFPVVYSGNGQGQRVGKFVPFTDNGTISNSVIFNHSDTTMQLQLPAPASAGNQKTFTFSCWFKRAKLGDQSYLYSVWDGTDHGAPYLEDRHYAQWRTDNTLYINFWGNGVMTSRTFEDTSKWYHYLLAVDSTQSTAADRIKLYIDGDLVTSFSSTSYFAQDSNLAFPKRAFTIGNTKAGDNAQEPFDGYIAEFNAIEGQALTPASFGLTDTSTGRWIPKTVSPYPTTTTDIAVTVVDSGGNKYALDGVTQGTVTLIEGATYKFDQSDSSNSGHPLRFSTTSDGTHGGGSEYTTGVTTVGTPGSSGAYTQITVATGAPTLYYYCTNHSGMGGTANTQDAYGTNGFRLQFQDSSSLGDDTSGNGLDFTATNLTATDQRTDSPSNNRPTLRPYHPSYSQSFSEGNLQHATTGINVGYPVCSTLRPKGSEKFYAECRISTTPGGYTIAVGCYAQEDLHNYSSGNAYPGLANLGSGLWIAGTNRLYFNGTEQSNPSVTFAAGDVIGLALDLDNGTLSFYDDDNSLIGTVPFDKTKSACFGAMSNKAVTFIWNFGDNPTFNGNETAGGNTDGDGNGNFFKSVPTGFKVLKQDNMAETAKGVSGLVWTKNRDTTDNHQLYDSSRGKQLALTSNTDGQETTVTDGLQKFLAGGQQIEDDVSINTASESFVTWNWVANGGTTASNTDGSITSTVQANTTAGFSIVQYTGTGSNATVGHGLSSAPEWVMSKVLNQASVAGFIVGCTPMGWTKYLQLAETTAANTLSTVWQDTAPTSSVFSLGTSGGVNLSSKNFIAYCWHSVDGFSKFGKYTGKGADNFIYTGFSPALVVIKKAAGGTFGTGDSDWMVFDNVTDFNQTTYRQYNRWNLSNAESYTNDLPFLANGFMLTGASNSLNATSGTYVYMAFAEHPFVGDGTSPVTAR
jgi:hypothetical protein